MDNRIIELESLITKRAQEYYEGHPTISDKEFDDLVDKLKSLDPNNSLLLKVGWGYNPMEAPTTRAKVPHKWGLVTGISDKRRDATSIDSKYSKCVLSDKLDGLSATAEYKDGVFIQGITRGNGSVGIDITDKLATRVPKRLDNFTGVIRGELVISKANWTKIIESNPDAEIRNYAAGVMMRSAVSDDLQYIDFVPYKIHGTAEVNDWSTPRIKNWLSERFPTCRGLFMIWDELSAPNQDKFFEDYRDNRNHPYPIDGVVCTLDTVGRDSATGQLLYEEFAYKFQSERVVTKVKSIQWNTSRTGMIVPVINIEPVHIAGATISRATAYNADFIENEHITVGCSVELERSGEVIPKIIKVVDQNDDKAYDIADYQSYYNNPDIPTTCPSCGARLVRLGAVIKCISNECSAQGRASIHHWIGSLARPEGLGYSTIDKFIEFFQIKTVEDLYTKVDTWRIKNMDGVGPSTEKKLLEMIEGLKSSHNPIDFLVACNIPGVSYKSAERLVQSGVLSSILLEDSIESIENKIWSIKGAGQALVDSIIDNIDMIKGLYKYITLKDAAPSANLDKSVKYIMVTGSLMSMSRSKFSKYISQYGWELTSSVTQASYLVTNVKDGTSSKYRAALANNIPIITEDEFMNMLKGI